LIVIHSINQGHIQRVAAMFSDWTINNLLAHRLLTR